MNKFEAPFFLKGRFAFDGKRNLWESSIDADKLARKSIFEPRIATSVLISTPMGSEIGMLAEEGSNYLLILSAESGVACGITEGVEVEFTIELEAIAPAITP